MHPAAMTAMSGMIQRYTGENASVIDVGSLDVNGNYRGLIESRGWSYVGLDLQEGNNVDIVAESPYNYPIRDNTFDIVISGSTMEHVSYIWKWVPELVRILRPGGLLCIVTHWSFPLHRYPKDYWRIMPDGMELLFDETGLLGEYKIELVNSQDIAGSAFKVKNS